MPRNYYIPWYRLHEFMDHIDWSIVKRAEVRPFSNDEVSVDTYNHQSKLGKNPFKDGWEP